MGENSLTQEKVNPAPVKKINLLKIGVLEIGFAAIFLLLLLGILNYFNILPISSSFPKYFGWLPRQTLIQKKTLYTPANPTPFQYDVKKAENILTDYIKATLKPEFISKNIDIKQGLSMNGKQEDIRYQFVYIINSQEATISANFIYDENTNTPSDYGIFIQPSNSAQSAPTVALANLLLSSYFSNPYTVSNCQTKGVISYCENFQTTNKEKSGYGYGTVLNPSTNKITLVIFTCFMPKESKYYALLTSCIASQ